MSRLASLALLCCASSASGQTQLSSGVATSIELIVPPEHTFLKDLTLRTTSAVPGGCAGGAFVYKVKNTLTLFKGTPYGKEHEELSNDLVIKEGQVKAGDVPVGGASKWTIAVGFNVTTPTSFAVTLTAPCDIVLEVVPEWYVLNAFAGASSVSPRISVSDSQTVIFGIPSRTSGYAFVQSVWMTAVADGVGCTELLPEYHILYTTPSDTGMYTFRDSCLGCAAGSRTTWYPVMGAQSTKMEFQLTTSDLAGCTTAPVLESGVFVMYIDEDKGVVAEVHVPEASDTAAPSSGSVPASPLAALLIAAAVLLVV